MFVDRARARLPLIPCPFSFLHLPQFDHVCSTLCGFADFAHVHLSSHFAEAMTSGGQRLPEKAPLEASVKSR